MLCAQIDIHRYIYARQRYYFQEKGRNYPMEQRVYQGNINPEGLADYLVQTFNQNYNYTGWSGGTLNTMAQKVGQGDHLLVQIAQARPWSGRVRTALGVSISRVPGGVSVSTGQTNWLDSGMIGMLIGAVFFPPLVIFPLIRGINTFTFYQDVWQAVDTYCTQAGARQASATTAHGVYCYNCGAINDEGAERCHICGAPLGAAQMPHAQAPQQGAQAPEMVTCPNCHERVVASKFCGNCGTPLTAQPTNPS
jgi:hypothetical protein